MLKNNIYIIILITVFLTKSIFAQTKEDLKKQKEDLEKEIAYTTKLLSKVTNEKKKSVNYLKVLEKQIVNQKKLIKTLDKESQLIERQVRKTNQKISATKENILSEEKVLVKLKNEYAKMIYKMFVKKGSRSDLIFIISSDNFNQAYKRMAYLKQYTVFRKNQIKKIKQTKENLEVKTKNLQSQEKLLINASQEKSRVLKTKEEELHVLNKIKNEKTDISRQLFREEKRIKKDLKEKEEIKEKLNRKIRQIIEEEIKKLRVENSNKTYALTPEAIMLSKEFVSNKGSLPWPLSNGIIVGYYGKQKHSIFSGVETFNNGIDIATDKDSEIRSVFDGVISRIFFIKGIGKAILINHGEYFTVYSGVKEVLVKVDDKILAKEKIGIVATQYPEEKTELHFEIWKNYEKMDPAKWLYNAD